MDPWWTLKTASIPYWMLFNTESSLRRIENYIHDQGDLEDVFITLFSHGVESIGLPSIEEWEKIIQNSCKRGELIGVNKKKFPETSPSI